MGGLSRLGKRGVPPDPSRGEPPAFSGAGAAWVVRGLPGWRAGHQNRTTPEQNMKILRNSVRTGFVLVFCFFLLPLLGRADEPAPAKKKGTVIWQGYPRGYLQSTKLGQGGKPNSNGAAYPGNPKAPWSSSSGSRSPEMDQAERTRELHSRWIRSLVPY
jgi:hypothetical protein